MNRNRKNIVTFIIPLIIIYFLFQYVSQLFYSSPEISMDKLVKNISENNIKKIETEGSTVRATLNDKTVVVTEISKEFQQTFYDNYLKEKVDKGAIQYEAIREKEPLQLWSILPNIIMLGIMIYLGMFFLRRSSVENRQGQEFTKSKAVFIRDSSKKITFDDVAGLHEEKQELYEIVDFLKNPKKYIEIGGRIPKGVLLVGSPGTGKTYISRAVAGEANVPFFTISGSDFVELYVGVGASRVRDMFQEAKKNAPCIIFIDEIDAVGRRRGAGLGSGNDEREQTLNQLLVEMDGFTTNEGIIIMAATNRPDILDPALLRPGRFDRNIRISVPDVNARKEILEIHARNKKMATDVILEDIAKLTSGFSPAELENLMNEAALLGARTGQMQITQPLLEEAMFRIMAGPEKKSIKVVEKERKLTAYHEAGHAITTHFLPDLDPVNFITIIPRGYAGGFTAFIPEEDLTFSTKKRMFNQIVSLLGGRASEELILDDISTGASNDIEVASKIARSMVMTYGMSDTMGLVHYKSSKSDVFIGGEYGSGNLYSEQTAMEIDNEVKKIIGDAYEKAKYILTEKIEFLHDLSQELLKKETLRKNQFLEIAKKYE